jgi:hypothetical protein
MQLAENADIIHNTYSRASKKATPHFEQCERNEYIRTQYYVYYFKVSQAPL